VQNRGVLAQARLVGLGALLNGDPTGLVEGGVKRLFRHGSAFGVHIEATDGCVAAISVREGPLQAVECYHCGAFRLVALRTRRAETGMRKAVLVACRHLRKAHRLDVLTVNASGLPPGLETVVAEAMMEAAAP
jgi:hypothetical protein